MVVRILCFSRGKSEVLNRRVFSLIIKITILSRLLQYCEQTEIAWAVFGLNYMEPFPEILVGIEA